jgi:outer membrane protein TolC
MDRADRGLDLAHRSLFPDLAVTAGLMPRGGLPPMWQATLAFSIPVFAGQKQTRNIAENEALASASRQGAETIRQILHQRVHERRAALAAALDVLRLYRSGLLVQSRATAESTLAQYKVGRISFVSVLEAIAGYIQDETAFLRTVADAQRIEIARSEVSLSPLALAGAAGMESGSMPGAGGRSPAMGRVKPSGPAGSDKEAPSESMGRM